MGQLTDPVRTTRLQGRKLLIVRAAFWLLVGVMLLVGAASYFLYFTRDGWQLCSGTTVQCQVKLQYSTAQAADFVRHGVPFERMVAIRYLALALASLVSIGMGFFIALRRSDDWMALLMALVLIQGGTVTNDGIGSALTRAVPEWTSLVDVVNRLSIPMLVLVLGLFPNGRPVPAWMRIGMPLICAITLLLTLAPPTRPRELTLASAVVIIFLFGLLIYSQLVRYRRYSTPSERKQTKWAVMGLVLLLLTYMISILLFSIDPFGDNQLLKAIAGLLGFNLLPGLFFASFMGIAILRSRLWDIDVIIRRTATYTLLTGALLLVFFGNVIILQQLFASLTGSRQNELVTVLSTLAIAALFVPLRNRIQELIDRRFNRRKYDSQKVLARFAATARDETNLEKLKGQLLEVVDETTQPASASVWLKPSSLSVREGRRRGEGVNK